MAGFSVLGWPGLTPGHDGYWGLAVRPIKASGGKAQPPARPVAAGEPDADEPERVRALRQRAAVQRRLADLRLAALVLPGQRRRHARRALPGAEDLLADLVHRLDRAQPIGLHVGRVV